MPWGAATKLFCISLLFAATSVLHVDADTQPLRSARLELTAALTSPGTGGSTAIIPVAKYTKAGGDSAALAYFIAALYSSGGGVNANAFTAATALTPALKAGNISEISKALLTVASCNCAAHKFAAVALADTFYSGKVTKGNDTSANGTVTTAWAGVGDAFVQAPGDGKSVASILAQAIATGDAAGRSTANTLSIWVTSSIAGGNKTKLALAASLRLAIQAGGCSAVAGLLKEAFIKNVQWRRVPAFAAFVSSSGIQACLDDLPPSVGPTPPPTYGPPSPKLSPPAYSTPPTYRPAPSYTPPGYYTPPSYGSQSPPAYNGQPTSAPPFRRRPRSPSNRSPWPSSINRPRPPPKAAAPPPTYRARPNAPFPDPPRTVLPPPLAPPPPTAAPPAPGDLLLPDCSDFATLAQLSQELGTSIASGNSTSTLGSALAQIYSVSGIFCTPGTFYKADVVAAALLQAALINEVTTGAAIAYAQVAGGWGWELTGVLAQAYGQAHVPPVAEALGEAIILASSSGPDGALASGESIVDALTGPVKLEAEVYADALDRAIVVGGCSAVLPALTEASSAITGGAAVLIKKTSPAVGKCLNPS